MLLTHKLPGPQAGAGKAMLYLGLSALALVAAVVVFLALRDTAQQEQTAAGTGPTMAEEQARQAEPPPVRTVDLQQTEIEDTAPPPESEPDAQGTATSGDQGLFERGGKTVPLTDGLAGGSEAKGAQATPRAERIPNAVDAFDFGVLDGRVRIGVFGKGGIPDYKASVSPSLIVIQMPGEFRYVEDFSRTLQINQFGVSTARLARDARGMRMSIAVTGDLRHDPFLIEDPQGLMVAFEPKR